MCKGYVFYRIWWSISPSICISIWFCLLFLFINWLFVGVKVFLVVPEFVVLMLQNLLEEDKSIVVDFRLLLVLFYLFLVLFTPLEDLGEEGEIYLELLFVLLLEVLNFGIKIRIFRQKIIILRMYLQKALLLLQKLLFEFF